MPRVIKVDKITSKVLNSVGHSKEGGIWLTFFNDNFCLFPNKYTSTLIGSLQKIAFRFRKNPTALQIYRTIAEGYYIRDIEALKFFHFRPISSNG
jgi:hypothetical protein